MENIPDSAVEAFDLLSYAGIGDFPDFELFPVSSDYLQSEGSKSFEDPELERETTSRPVASMRATTQSECALRH